MKNLELPTFKHSIDQLPANETESIWQQFKRDLQRTALDDENNYSTKFGEVYELMEEIQKILQSLREGQEEKFWQLLYLVDLPEGLLKQTLDHDPSLRELARMVVIREWQKVLIYRASSAS